MALAALRVRPSASPARCWVGYRREFPHLAESRSFSRLGFCGGMALTRVTAAASFLFILCCSISAGGIATIKLSAT